MPAASGWGFPASYRLRTPADFAAMRRGRRIPAGCVRVVWRPNGGGHARLGLAVSRKYGGAVARNRLKRVLRECFRTHPVRNLPVDVMVIAVSTPEHAFPASTSGDARGVIRDFPRALDRIVREFSKDGAPEGRG